MHAISLKEGHVLFFQNERFGNQFLEKSFWFRIFTQRKDKQHDEVYDVPKQ